MLPFYKAERKLLCQPGKDDTRRHSGGELSHFNPASPPPAPPSIHRTCSHARGLPVRVHEVEIRGLSGPKREPGNRKRRRVWVTFSTGLVPNQITSEGSGRECSSGCAWELAFRQEENFETAMTKRIRGVEVACNSLHTSAVDSFTPRRFSRTHCAPASTGN
jgi:hypothetical protein